MKCALCGGNLVKETVQEEVKVHQDHIMVDVEAEVCQNCHERYFEEGVIDRLIAIKKKVIEREFKLPKIGEVYRAIGL